MIVRLALSATILFTFLACDSPAGPRTGSLALTVRGLPSGTDAAITVTGPNGTSQPITGTRTLSNLPPGTYTVQVAEVAADEIYRAAAPSTTITIAASLTPSAVTVDYRAVTGTLSLTGTGLPPSATPVFDVTGPQNFSASFTGAQSVSRLAPGDYTVNARQVADNATRYTATNSPMIVTVTAGALTAATARYVVAVTLNLQIDGAYLTQSVQRYDGSVPLVAGRIGYLRIFAVANEANTAAPAVRVRLLNNGALVSTRLLAPGTPGVPLSPDQGSTGRSWSMQIDGSLIQPGFGYLVDVDPDNLVQEVNEFDNSFPATGVPRVQTVLSVAPLDVTLVPILTAVNGLMGSVNDADRVSYLETTLRMYPLSTYSTDVRAPFATNASVGPGPDELASLNQILNELDALRIAEGSTRYYAGIVKLGAGSSFSGVGYIGRPTSVSYDLQPGAPVALAHEFGHTAGRRHAPCGNAANPDVNYPYPNASIGTYGFDVATETIYSPSSAFDLMSYCSPRWLSDYTYEGVMSFRNASQLSGQVRATGSAVVPRDALVIWGRLENGRLILEPAFSSRTSAATSTSGSYRAEGLDVHGSRLFLVSFEPSLVADASPGAKQFALAVPLDAERAKQLSVIRVTGEGRAAERRAVRDESVTVADIPVRISASPLKNAVAVSWPRERYAMAIIRDADSGEIIAFARNGAALVKPRNGRVDVVLTDGVQSVRTTW